MAESVETIPQLVSQDTTGPTKTSLPTIGGDAAASIGGMVKDKAEEDRERRQRAERRNAQMAFEEYWNTRKSSFTPDEHEHAWDVVTLSVKKYSDEMIERWNKEIDTLLVYAGLFSAILTAFNVQSYQLLTPPAPDPVITALQQISAQLSSFSVSPNFLNATQPAFLLHQPDPLPAPKSAVWLNSLWFSSLICSLSAASVGIMVKQWLNEYSSGISTNSRQLARLRQHRLNALVKWRVAEIVAVLPVLLQVASGLFFAGLLVLLWNLDSRVAIVATALVSVLGFFSLITMVLPAVTSDCSYLSPPARAIFEILRPAKRAFYICCYRMMVVLDWVEECIPTDSPSVLGRLSSCFARIEDSSKATLRGKELSLVSSWTGHLDADSVSMAYTTTMSPHHLDSAAICFTDLSPGTASLSARTILSQNLKQWGRDRHTSMMRSVRPCMWSGVMAAMLARTGQGQYSAVEVSSSLDSDLWTAYHYIYWMRDLASGAAKDGDAAALRVLCMDFVNIILHSEICEIPTRAGDPPLYLLGDLANLLAHQHVVLGTDARLSVANHLEGFIRRRVRDFLNGQESYTGWYSSLRCMVFCVPKEPSMDCVPGDEAYEAARVVALRSLEVFAQLLYQPSWGDEGVTTSQQIHSISNSIFYLFQEAAQPVGLVSPVLVRGMAHYLYRYERTHGRYEWEEQRDWIVRLERDLHISELTSASAAAQAGASPNHTPNDDSAPVNNVLNHADGHMDPSVPPMCLSSQTSLIVPPARSSSGGLGHTNDGARTSDTPPPTLLSP